MDPLSQAFTPLSPGARVLKARRLVADALGIAESRLRWEPNPKPVYNKPDPVTQYISFREAVTRALHVARFHTLPANDLALVPTSEDRMGNPVGDPPIHYYSASECPPRYVAADTSDDGSSEAS